MKEILKSVSKLSLPTGLNLLSSLIRNKILALVVGPVGLGIFSQISNLSVIASSVFPIGSLGLVRYIANYYEDKRLDEISYFIKYFFKRNLFFSFILMVLVLLFRNPISEILFSNSDLSNLLVLLAIFIPINLILSFIDIYLRGIRKIDTYVLFLSLNSIITVACSIPLIYYFNIEGAVLALLITVIINIFNGYLILKKKKLTLSFKSKLIVEKSVIKNIYNLGIATLVSMVVQNVTIIIIKSLIANKLGLNFVGIFQCVYAISASYFGVFFAVIGTYSLPKVSSFKKNEEINNELNNTIKFLLIIYVPIIIFMFISRSFVISILYSNDFLEAKYLLIFQLPAELLRAFSWVMGLWLIPKLKIKQWIAFELIFYSLFFMVFYFLIEYFEVGVKSASIAYLVSYFVFFLINYFYSVRNISFKITINNIKIFVISILFLFSAYIISYISETAGYYIILPLLIMWSLLIIKKSDILKLIKMVKNR